MPFRPLPPPPQTRQLAALRAHAGSDSLGGRFSGGFEEQNSVSESMSDLAYEDEDEPAMQTSEKTTCDAV